MTPRFSVNRLTYLLPDGRTHAREVIQHPGAVVIVPILNDGRICLIRNYRVAVNQELLELPAGTLEPNEPPIDTARRELREETGFYCERIEPLAEFCMSPGILNERMFAFVAEGLTAGAQALEKGEMIENLLVNRQELDELLDQGLIQDSKTLSALFMYLRRRS